MYPLRRTVRARLMLERKTSTPNEPREERTMTITADRISDTEVKVDQAIYTFESKGVADAFQQCLGPDSVDACKAHHPPIATRAADVDGGPAEGEPGSIIAPSLGGMP
jgi:hypothetical protein